jgi:N6-adenosine-specific RNA methylase IME4
VKDLIEIPKCEVSKVGLKLDENLTFDEWKGIGLQLQTMQGSIGFWIGDWWNFGERKYGEKATQALEMGIAYETFRKFCWVSKTIESVRRRTDLSFSSHEEIASAPIEKQDELLDKAIKEKLSSRELRHIVRDYKHSLLPIMEIPKGKFDIIYCDPPWKYEFCSDIKDEIENKYPTMELEDIKKLEIPTADNCVLLMWATAPKLEEAIEVINFWGFSYRTCAVWDKEWIGMGYWFRGQHELLLVATKGSPRVPEQENRYSSMIKEKRTEHSKKPICIYEMIEKMFPNSKYLELFARNKRERWVSYGNEIK